MYKRFLSMIFALALMLACARFSFVQAAGNELYLEIAESGGEVTVMLKAGTELTFGGISGTIEYDRGAFGFVSARSGVLSLVHNAATGFFAADTGMDLYVDRGQTLIEFTFAKASGYNANRSYDFIALIESAYDFNIEYYDWSIDMRLAGVLRGAAATDEPAGTAKPTAAPTPKPTPKPTQTPAPAAATQQPTATNAPSVSTPAPANTPAPAPTQPPAQDTAEPTGTGPATVLLSVTYEDAEGKVLFVESVGDGETITPPELPEGCDAWTLNGQPYDFSLPVYGDLTLRASVSEEPGAPIETAGETAPAETEPSAEATAPGTGEPNASQAPGDEAPGGEGGFPLAAVIIAGVSAAALGVAAGVLIGKKHRKK